MATVYGQKFVNSVAAHHSDTQAAIRRETNKVAHHAESNLARARASTEWHKIHGPDHLTDVTKSFGDTDGFVNLEAPNPMAIEFGHAPSGVFGPGGSLGHLDTKSPDGLYILTRAAIAGTVS